MINDNTVIDCNPLKNESLMDYLMRIGNLKTAKIINCTWDEIARWINTNYKSSNAWKTESHYRKLYKALSEEKVEIEESIDMKQETNNKDIHALEKEKVKIHDERVAYNRLVRSESRQDALLDLFRTEIRKYDSVGFVGETEYKNNATAVYAMLSDIHYGIEFSTMFGKYNSDIARTRIMNYAKYIVDIGKDCSECYVSLMGDLVSGNIHSNIRVENKENIIEQVVGVSELISDFLLYLSRYFNAVFVNSVDGNHSRLDPNLENVMRGEKLDALIPWYCEAKLANIDNVYFKSKDSYIDCTIADFEIFGKTYISVHGDNEKDLKLTATRIEKALSRHVDYLLAGHLHVPDMRFEDTGYIRNGCVSGSGDDYTMRNRLYSPACQVAMIVSENGVESLHPFKME